MCIMRRASEWIWKTNFGVSQFFMLYNMHRKKKPLRSAFECLLLFLATKNKSIVSIAFFFSAFGRKRTPSRSHFLVVEACISILRQNTHKKFCDSFRNCLFCDKRNILELAANERRAKNRLLICISFTFLLQILVYSTNVLTIAFEGQF